MPFTHRQLRRKDAGTTAGASLSGPGGLLATPGMGRLRRFKAKKIVGNLYRGDTGQFQAGGAGGPASAAPAPKPRRKPAKTEQERTQRRQEQQQATAAQRQQNRAKVLSAVGIPEDAAGALDDLRNGIATPDDGGLVKLGLAEQAADGSYRLSATGRAFAAAADAGDAGRARDTLSRARDQQAARTERQAAQVQRRTAMERRRQEAAARRAAQSAKKPAGGGKKPKPKKPIDAARRMRRINKRIARFLGRTRAAKSFAVFKDASGALRWLSRTTTAYRDRDREILPIAALDQDSQRMTAAGQFGPLRFWHIGRPDPLDAAQPWGPGLDVGTCDFSTQIGTTRVESGTFKSAALARRIAETADEYELSPGFFHPPDQPSADGVFTTIRTFERSLVPIKYGRASNLFTGLTVKGVRMDPDEMERRFKAAIAQLQLPPEQAAALSAGLIQSDKSAQAQGIAYKSAPATVVIGGVTYTAEQPIAPPIAPTPPDVVINGVTYKAAPPFVAEDEKAKMSADEMIAAGETELADGLDDAGMDDAALVAAIADAVVAKIAPLFGDMKLSEMKAMFATKDDSRAQQVAQLEATLKSVQDQLAALSGAQPAVVLPDDIAAALKSQGPSAPPDPNQPQLPADASPLTQLAARLAPQLYANTPNGAFNGWTPPVLPQS